VSKHHSRHTAALSAARRLWHWLRGERHAHPPYSAAPDTDPPEASQAHAAEASARAAEQERLAAIEQQMQALAAQMHSLPDSLQDSLQQQHEATAHTREALEKLEKQISRAGREQLKANSLSEAQLERLSSTIEMLRSADMERSNELEHAYQQMAEAQATARLDVVQRILPALDGIDEALRSGQAILDKPFEPAARGSGLLRWLGGPEAPPDTTADELRNTMHSWLVGLSFIQQRLLDALEAEGVRPIVAQGQPFDPQVHIAMHVVPAADDMPPGMVAAELRRGYLAGEHVLRHAEVAVTKGDMGETASTGNHTGMVEEEAQT
jgi:molecular chaperone GrpE